MKKKMVQWKNGADVKNCQCIFINHCQLTHFCRSNEISEMFSSGLEEQKPMHELILRECWIDFELWRRRCCCWMSNSLIVVGLVVGVQTAGIIRQEEEQDPSKNILADFCGGGLVSLEGQV